MGDYYWGGDIDYDITIAGNYWQDAEKTTPAGVVPGVGDTVFACNSIDNEPYDGISYADWNIAASFGLSGGDYYGAVDGAMYAHGCNFYATVIGSFAGSSYSDCIFHAGFSGMETDFTTCTFHDVFSNLSDETALYSCVFTYAGDNAVMASHVMFAGNHTFPGDVSIGGMSLWTEGDTVITFQRRMRLWFSFSDAGSNWLHGSNSPDLPVVIPPAQIGIGL